MVEQALRYNQGKVRYSLLPEKALEDVATVFTRGAEKYTVRDDAGNIVSAGDDNWRRGLPWNGCIDSALRHIQAFKGGEDYDPDLKTKHLANAVVNLMFILEYYHVFPQGDNRAHTKKKKLKIGLDIDDVLADFIGDWIKHHEIPLTNVGFWNFSYDTAQKFKDMSEAGEFNDFYSGLSRNIDPEGLPFEPHCYITSRSVDINITEKWLESNGFPAKKVYSLGFGQSKVDAAKEAGIDVFVDDRYENFVELNQAGILCYLFDAPHNQRYDVGARRIKSLQELKHLA